MKAELELLHSTYAKALFGYGKERACLDELIGDFENAIFIFEKEKSLAKIVKDPRIDLKQKEGLLDEINKRVKFSKDFLNFIKLLISRKRFDIFHGIFLKFSDMCDVHRGCVKVFLYSSVRLSGRAVNKIKKSLKKSLKKDIVIEEIEDEGLVGGIKIQFEDKVYDGSIRKNLENIRELIRL